MSDRAGPDLLAAAASLRWVRPDLTGAVAEHVLATAAADGDRDRWLAAAGWSLHARSATGDGRPMATDLLGELAGQRRSPLSSPAARRLRVELGLLAAAGGELAAARRLIEPVALGAVVGAGRGRLSWASPSASGPTQEAAGAELRADALAALARCAVEDRPAEVPDLIGDAESAWSQVAGPVGAVGAASVALLTASSERRAGRPDAAVERAAGGLAQLDRIRRTADAPTPSGHLAAALAAEWVSALLDAGRVHEACEGCVPLEARLAEHPRPTRQLARLRVTVARIIALGSDSDAEPATAAVERAARDATDSDDPDLEGLCRSTLGTLYEQAGRVDVALDAMQLAMSAQRRDHDRGVAFAEALRAAGPFEDGWVARHNGRGAPAAQPHDHASGLPVGIGRHAGPVTNSAPICGASDGGAPDRAGNGSGLPPVSPWSVAWDAGKPAAPVHSFGAASAAMGRGGGPQGPVDRPGDGDGTAEVTATSPADGPVLGLSWFADLRWSTPAGDSPIGDMLARGIAAGRDSTPVSPPAGPAGDARGSDNGPARGEQSPTPLRTVDATTADPWSTGSWATGSGAGSQTAGTGTSGTGAAEDSPTGGPGENVEGANVLLPSRRGRTADAMTAGRPAPDSPEGTTGVRRDAAGRPTPEAPVASGGSVADAGTGSATLIPPVASEVEQGDGWLQAALAELDRVWGPAVASVDPRTGTDDVGTRTVGNTNPAIPIAVTQASVTQASVTPTVGFPVVTGPSDAVSSYPAAAGCVVVVDVARSGRRFAGLRAGAVVRAVAGRLADHLPSGARLRDDHTDALSVVMPGWSRAAATEWMQRTLPEMLEDIDASDDLPGAHLRAAVHDADGPVGAQILQRIDRSLGRTGSLPRGSAGMPAARSAPNNSGPDRTAHDRTAPDRAGREPRFPGPARPSGPDAAERPRADRDGADRVGADRVGSGRDGAGRDALGYVARRLRRDGPDDRGVPAQAEPTSMRPNVAASSGGRHGGSGREPFRLDGLPVEPGSGGRRHRPGPDAPPQVDPPGGRPGGPPGEPAISRTRPQPPTSTEGLGLADLLAGALAAYRGI